MVFDWFFNKGSGFEQFERELNKIETFQTTLDDLLLSSDKKFNKKQTQESILSIIGNIKNIIFEFNKLLIENEILLKKYINTSIEMVDYPTQVKETNSKITKILEKVNSDFFKKEAIDFIDEALTLKNELNSLIKKLEEDMKKFKEQSKKSLEWNYEARSNNISLVDFRGKVNKLGGKIDPTMGKGGHFGVVFRLFVNTIGPSRKSIGEIAGGTLDAFIDQRANIVNPYFDVKYLKCYFFRNNPTFIKIFIAKYKYLFEL